MPPVWLTSKLKLPSLVWPDVGVMVCPIVSVTVVSQGVMLDTPSQAAVVLIVCAAAGEASAASTAPQNHEYRDTTRHRFITSPFPTAHRYRAMASSTRRTALRETGGCGMSHSP